jgi:hypothetical protein
METEPNEIARQINAYPGINGLEVLTLGSRGGRMAARGLLVAPSEPARAALFQVFRNYALDGGAYVLVDPDGTVWVDVILERFKPDGETRPGPGTYFSRPYVASFLHIDA